MSMKVFPLKGVRADIENSWHLSLKRPRRETWQGVFIKVYLQMNLWKRYMWNSRSKDGKVENKKKRVEGKKSNEKG